MVPKISVNLVGYKHRKYLQSCFENALKQDYPNFEITFIDNNSGDGSEEFAREHFPQVRVIQTGSNTGYSGGHNIGVKESDGEFVMFLTPDVDMKPNFLSEMIKPLIRDPRIGGVGGKLLRPQPIDGKYVFDTTGIIIQHSRRAIDRRQLSADVGQYDTAEEVFAVNGACPLYRRSALMDAAIDGEVLDEDIFAYWDDVDLGWRLRNFGWKIWYQPTAVAYHERAQGRSKGGYKKIFNFIRHHRQFSLFTRKLNWKNHIFMIIKNDFGWPMLRDLPKLLARETAMLGYMVVFEPKTLTVIPTFFKQLPNILRKRKIIKSRRKMTDAEMDHWLSEKE